MAALFLNVESWAGQLGVQFVVIQSRKWRACESHFITVINYDIVQVEIANSSKKIIFWKLVRHWLGQEQSCWCGARYVSQVKKNSQLLS